MTNFHVYSNWTRHWTVHNERSETKRPKRLRYILHGQTKLSHYFELYTNYWSVLQIQRFSPLWKMMW